MSSTEAVSDPLVLAAIDRAERHRTDDRRGVPVWQIYEHLTIVKRSALARHVRARLDVLETSGSLERSRRHSILLWALTSNGRRRLARARRAGNVPELPESPQHVAWRKARAAAESCKSRFRIEAGEAVLETFFLLDAAPPTPSDVWFEMAPRLQRACWLLGSASYCLHEWAEPDDARPDVDDHTHPTDKGFDPAERTRRRARRAGRRSVWLWGEQITAGESD